MSIAFDQYQRYKNVQLVIDELREPGQRFRILEVGANEHKNLEKFLSQDEIYYLDVRLPENLLNDPCYFLGDATAMNFRDSEFDVIVAVDVYEHISPEKRESFLSELYRVSKKFFVICAPFYSPEVVDAEIRANLVYKSVYGEDYIWLKEHQGNGLPNFKEVKEFLLNRNISFFSFSHGDINIWEKMMNAHFLSVRDASLVHYCNTLDKYYEKHIFACDYVEYAYRKFIVGFKVQNEKNIMFSKKESISIETIQQLDFLLENFNTLFANKNNDRLLTMINEMKNGKHNQLQVFYDYGDGFSEENSIKISYEGLSFSTFVAIPEKAIAIRIDPTENMFCVVTDFKAETEYGECSIQVKDAEKIGNVYSF